MGVAREGDAAHRGGVLGTPRFDTLYWVQITVRH